MALLITIFIAIHLLELAGYLIYVQYRKNEKLERIVNDQEGFISNVTQIVRAGRVRLDELDQLGAFRSDDELGVFFSNLKNIQDVLDNFTSQRQSKQDAS